MTTDETENDWQIYVQRHWQFAWWSLLFFLALGIFLEALHGFKTPMYLNVGLENRRLMWTLAHGSGTILAIVHAAFAATVYALPKDTVAGRWLASPFLMSSSMLIPGGFFLGGVFLHDGEPGLGLRFLVPIGIALLLLSMMMTAWTVTSKQGGGRSRATRASRQSRPS